SVQISDAVQSLVGRLNVVPSFVIAKGGITSSDVGTKALAVKKTNVLGQIKPGIPVWQTGAESKFPLTPYVIFPGNVGEITTLREAAEVLMAC
ncbi:nucleotide-binding domain containing protein, partial [Eubacterium aggregans]|uniref:nucleotide-binding domain containing protein n=1 Tax=Eubacterium aggregans TaxID=81409 RepID=UPI003F3934DD